MTDKTKQPTEKCRANLMIHQEGSLESGYPIRTETFMGRTHLVAPVVLMVPGVHRGSAGPVLYTANELGKFAAAWNGRPVPVFHPEEDGNFISCNEPEVIERQSVGWLFNTRFAEGKLRGEIWVDEERATAISPTALEYLKSQRPMDVSTGLFSDQVSTQGVFKGEAYERVAKNLRPDHLALLPGGRGACSWEDGCGVRVNEKGGDNVTDEMKRTKLPGGGDNPTAAPEKVRLPHNHLTDSLEDMGYRELVETIRHKLDSMDDDYRMHFLEEVYDDVVIFKLSNRDARTEKFYRRSYQINDDRTVEFTGEPVHVAREVSYKEIPATNSEPTTNAEERETDMPLIDELIAHKSTKLEEGDREWLQALTECQLKKLVPAEPATDAPATNEQPAVDGKEQAIEVLREHLKNPDEFLSAVPPEFRDQFESGLRLHNEKRAQMIEGITANSDFTAEELEKKPTSEMEKLHGALVKPQSRRPSYIGNGSGMSHNQQQTDDAEILLPAGMEVE